jgi:N-acetylmuramic acid 6-phosphate etherase
MPNRTHTASGTDSNKPLTELENAASRSLDMQSTQRIVNLINGEDHKVAPAVRKVLPHMAEAVDLIVPALSRGGRMVYLGAGTSGRLGLLDAAECAPTFGTDQVIGLLAGGPQAMFQAAEGAEDDAQAAVRDLRKIRFSAADVLVGIAASGRTPYVMSGLRHARRMGAPTVVITVNPDAPMIALANVAIVPVVGPEIIAGSTRMKAGTAQKLVLNTLSTAVMVRLGRVLSGMMVNVQLTNAKLRMRAQSILAKASGLESAAAGRALKMAGGNLPVALLMHWQGLSRDEAERQLKSAPNTAVLLRQAEEAMKRQKRRTGRA